MKKQRILLFLLALLLAAAASAANPIKLKRFTVVNKSRLPIELRLVGEELEDNEYFLRVAEGNPDSPTTQVFTVIPDTYLVTVYFDELWDPVYGTVCSGRSATVDLNHNARLVVGICTNTPAAKDEAPHYKLGAPQGERPPNKR